MRKIHCLYTINFLAAFLLFQIELIISKIFLPRFGGSYLVWGACVVFFQCALLFGYLYSHLVIQKIGISRYRRWHSILLFLPLLCFPGRPLGNIISHSKMPIVFDIFWQLLFNIGLVFFVLSTTSIVFQSWLSESGLAENANPYRLYAVSNLGSFLALLSYPFFFEARFDLNGQLNIWRLCYLVLLVLHIIAFITVKVTDKPGEIRRPPQSGVSLKQKLRWFLFAASGAAAFLSVTNIITYEITPAPLLWIIPLSIYLLSFVLNFKAKPYCPDWIRDKFYLVAAFSVLVFFLVEKNIFPVFFEIAAYSLSLFYICMFCQNQLVRNKPGSNGDLTVFYLVIATGSFFGGILVSWIIPFISTLMIEFLLSLLFIYAALIIDEKAVPIRFYHLRMLFYLGCLIMIWPLRYKEYNVFGLAIIILLFKFIYTQLKTDNRAVFLSISIVTIIAPVVVPFWKNTEFIYIKRNYYGIYKIFEEGDVRFLMNGNILHGAQSVYNKEKEMEPLAYFHRLTPVGKLMESSVIDLRDVGIVGLGAGSLAAYGKKDMTIDFFELDKDIFLIAEKYFTYLKKSPAKINHIFGDARISLSKIPDRRYDLLIIDAFSGDSVPVHLLTLEAISEYKRHINNNGAVLFHASNRYLDLISVLFSNGKALNAYPMVSYNQGDNEKGISPSIWVALTWDKDLADKFVSQLKWKKKSRGKRIIKYIRPWTDSYSDILCAFNKNELFNSVKNFRLFFW